MAVNFKNGQDFLNKLQLVTNIFIAIPLVGFIYLFLKIANQTYDPDLLTPEILVLLRVSIFMLVIIIVSLGIVAFNRQVKSLNPEMHLRDKLELYYSAATTRSILIEVASLIVLLGYALSAEEVYVAYYAICLIGFSLSYPTLLRIANQLRLKREDRELLFSRDRNI